MLALLPPDSFYAQATVGEQATWGVTDHLLATVVDVLNVSNWLYVSAHSKSKVTPPIRMQRPGVAPDRDGKLGGTKYTQVEMRTILDTWEQRAGDQFTSEKVG